MDFTNLINVDVDKRTSESILSKFLVRSEITPYTWNEMTMERNDRIPCPAFPVSWAVLALWAVAEFFRRLYEVFRSFACWCFLLLFFFMYRKSRAMLVLAFLL